MLQEDNKITDPLQAGVQQGVSAVAQQGQPSAYGQALQELNNMPEFDANKFAEEYKNRGQRPILDILMGSYTKPQPAITPEQEKRARTAAAISDSLSTLAEMWGHSQGARVRPSDGNTSTNQTNARLRDIQNKYEQNLANYNNLYTQAAGNDFSSQLRSAMEANGQKRQNIIYKANKLFEENKIKEANARKDAEIKARKEAEAEKQKWEKEKWEKEYNQRERQNNASNAISWYNARKSGASEADKDVFEIAVPNGTPGAVYDPYTQKTYIRQKITPARKASIIANLKNGKSSYAITNKLYKPGYTDLMGIVHPGGILSDDEIVKYWLEHDYQKQPANKPSSTKPGTGGLY